MEIKDFKTFLKVGDIVIVKLCLTDEIIRGSVSHITDESLIITDYKNERHFMRWGDKLISLNFLHKQI